MKTLMTQHSVLGILLAFVLALGVQGVAEAVQKPTAPSDSDLNPATVYDVGGTVTISALTITPDKVNSRETVRISKSSGIDLLGNFVGLSSVTLTEVEGDNGANGNSFTYTRDGRKETLSGASTGAIVILFRTKGKQTVTISGTDNEGDDKGSWSYKYTYYVKGAGTSTTTVSLLGNKTGLFSNEGNRLRIHNGDSSHYAVRYTTIPAAMAQIETTAGALSDLTTLNFGADTTTSSAFDVYLQVNGSYQVTAKVKDSERETVGVYIIGTPTLTVGHPGNPNGAGDSAVAGSKGDPGQIDDTLPAEDSPQNRAFTAIVKDGANGNVPGVVVKFQVSGSGTAGGYLVFDSTGDTPKNAGTLVSGSDNRKRLNSDGTELKTATDKILYVRTNVSGQADVDFQLGTDRKQDVTVSAVGKSKTVSAYAGTAQNQLVNPRSESTQVAGRTGEYELRVNVEDADETAVSGQWVEFRTNDGTLDAPAGSQPTLGGIRVQTDTQGIALIFFDPTDSGDLRVTGHLLDPGSDGNIDGTDDTVIDNVVFNVRGGGTTTTPTTSPTTQPADTTPTTPATNIIAVNPTTISGAPGGTETLLVLSPSTADVEGNAAFTSAGGSISGSGLTRTVTLPNTAGTNYSLTASASEYDDRVIPVTVTGSAPTTSPTTSQQGTLTVVQEGQQIRVTASPAPSSNLVFTITSNGVGAGGGEILTTGSGRAIPIGLTTGSHVLTVSAQGYQSTQISFTVGTQTTPTTSTTTPTTGQAGVANSIEIDGSRSRSGTLAQALPLRIRVLNANNDGVRGVGVTFRVLAPGQGTFAGARGSGRAVRVETDRTGYAIARFTPSSEGNIIVEAKAAGVSAPVTFIIEVGEGTPDTGTSDTAAARTYKVGDKVPISLEDTLKFTGSRTISGTVYTCVGSGECVVSYGTLVKGEIRATAVPKVEAKTYKVGDKISISLEDTLKFTGSRTVNGTTYTCVGSGECVVSYGTLSKGEIQVSMATASIPSDAARPIDPEVLLNAANRPPMLWVDGGSLYALVGADVQEFAIGVENVQNLAVSGNKVYYTEKTGENSGTINAMNLDGTGAKHLVSIKAVPQGIAVDPVGKRLYWTNSHGWIQSSNLQGTARRNVAKGLSNPMGIAVAAGKTVYWTEEGPSSPELLNGHTGQSVPGVSVAISGNTLYWTAKTGANAGTIHSVNLNGTGAKHLVSIKAVPQGIAVDSVGKRLYWTNSHGWIQSSNLQGTARRNVAKGLGSPGGIALSTNIKAPAATTPTKTTPAAKPNYDVDSSGTVDNADLFLVSLAVGTSNATYDVNGDGTVNDKDIALVRDNRDNGAAAAPMVVGVKLTAEQVDRLQAQIDLLIASGDRSPDALKTLVYLQQLIATARPEKTQLLANYPNPFNPETWIPYELATDTDVRITIYNAQGVVIRSLQLGQQSAGYYTDRERAAYWDGRNALGEQVASGVYFYQLETDEMSALRKMVILK